MNSDHRTQKSQGRPEAGTSRGKTPDEADDRVRMALAQYKISKQSPRKLRHLAIKMLDKHAPERWNDIARALVCEFGPRQPPKPGRPKSARTVDAYIAAKIDHLRATGRVRSVAGGVERIKLLKIADDPYLMRLDAAGLEVLRRAASREAYYRGKDSPELIVYFRDAIDGIDHTSDEARQAAPIRQRRLRTKRQRPK